MENEKVNFPGRDSFSPTSGRFSKKAEEAKTRNCHQDACYESESNWIFEAISESLSVLSSRDQM